MQPLDPEQLFRSEGERGPIGAAGEVLAAASSTIDVARERLHAGAADGYVVLAEHQTAGRGRTGSWDCPPGAGVLMSAVLRIGLPAAQQRLVVLMGAVAGAEAATGLGIPARIKWPNDIVVTAGEPDVFRVKKLGGVLVERVVTGEGPAAYILSIGLNVNQEAAELPITSAVQATSMRAETDRVFDRNSVCLQLFRELNRWYRRLAMGQAERVLARWRTLSCLLGRPVRARVDGRLVKGRVVGIRSTGELIFAHADGRQEFLTDGRTRLLL